LVVSVVPFHFTVEQGRKVLPLTFNRSAPLPTRPLLGDSDEIPCGAARLVVGVVNVKGTPVDAPDALDTDTEAVAAAIAVSMGKIVAVS
jgi:hypothetical protein